MKVLITGANGFIAKRFSRMFFREHELIGIVKQTPFVPVVGVNYIEHDLTLPVDYDRFPGSILHNHQITVFSLNMQMISFQSTLLAPSMYLSTPARQVQKPLFWHQVVACMVLGIITFMKKSPLPRPVSTSAAKLQPSPWCEAINRSSRQ